MTPNRFRWGALLWVLTLQFFVVEAVAQARWTGPYSRTDDVISALGSADSPARQLMNASFVLQAALILGGALLLLPVLRGAAARAVPVLLGAAALGVLLVGVFPTDGNGTAHAIGAVVYLAGGALGLVALAYAVRPISEALGTVVVLLGIVATAGTIFFLTGVTRYLGEGGMERAAAYPLPIALALSGAVLWWLGRGGDLAAVESSRRAERERERARLADQARARDAALESAAGTDRRTGTTAEDVGTDPEDPWAPPRPRG
ncbi:DUF998 domain-containing protein [Blastococcus sp. KM273128]|nr:DUF998 domain-containing protein [Blastococcus sp. KM273128]MCF6744691.1 DUF998 domain-containing protein [Blastococcus sp. KM273128]